MTREDRDAAEALRWASEADDAAEALRCLSGDECGSSYALRVDGSLGNGGRQTPTGIGAEAR